MIRATQALAALLAALALGACGQDEGEPIPADVADRLVAVLETAERQAAAGSCGTLLRDTIPSLDRRAAALPDSVGADTKQTIEDGIAHLRELATDQCNEREREALPTTTETTTPTTTEQTTTEQTTTEETTPPETTDTTPPETSTQETTPPETTPPETAPPGNGGTPPGASQGQGGTITP